MKKIITLNVVIAMILILGMTFTDAAECRGRGGPPPCPILTALDTDNNDIIAESELNNAAAVLLKLDSNGDGSLSQDELRPERPQRNGEQRGKGMRGGQEMQGGQRGGRGNGDHRPPASPLFTALDTDSDDTISSDEIQNAAAALKKLDANSDGTLTRDEVGPKHQRGPRN